MTQRQAAIDIIKRFDPKKTRAIAKDLQRVVDLAQNRPPDGESDGTLTEVDWYAVRDLAWALDELSLKIVDAQGRLKIVDAQGRLGIGKQDDGDPGPQDEDRFEGRAERADRLHLEAVNLIPDGGES